jgi:hypothetical protein
MSAQVLDIYERLALATDDRTRARIIAEASGALEDRYPQLSDLATRTHLTEIEYKLAKDIERTRLELTKKIEQVRADLHIELARTRTNILQWSFVFWLTQFAAILAVLWRVWPAS